MSDVKEKEEVVEQGELELDIHVEEEDEQSEEAEVSQEAVSTDEEHEQYSEGVKKRIDRLTYKMREAERREQAALDFAKKLKEENEKSL